ncbi:hypothetical protein V6Z11_D12G091500 [Gossypium hirsutum]
MYPGSGPLPCTEVKTSRRTSFSLPPKGKMQNANAKLPTYHDEKSMSAKGTPEFLKKFIFDTKTNIISLWLDSLRSPAESPSCRNRFFENKNFGCRLKKNKNWSRHRSFIKV